MVRYKWLNFLTPLKDYSEFAKLLSSRVYNDENGHGFLIDELREDYIHARFIRKINIVEELTSPAGEKFQQSYTSYESIKFQIGNETPGILLINPPQSLTSFINELGILTNFSSPISTKTIDLSVWTNFLQTTLDEQITILAMDCSGIIFKDGATGKMHLSNPNGIDPTYNTYLGSRKYDVKKVKLKIGDNIVQLSHTGLASIKEPSELLLQSLSASLAKLQLR